MGNRPVQGVGERLDLCGRKRPRPLFGNSPLPKHLVDVPFGKPDSDVFLCVYVTPVIQDNRSFRHKPIGERDIVGDGDGRDGDVSDEIIVGAVHSGRNRHLSDTAFDGPNCGFVQFSGFLRFLAQIMGILFAGIPYVLQKSVSDKQDGSIRLDEALRMMARMGTGTESASTYRRRSDNVDLHSNRFSLKLDADDALALLSRRTNVNAADPADGGVHRGESKDTGPSVLTRYGSNAYGKGSVMPSCRR